MSARKSTPRAQRLVAVGVLAAVLTSAGISTAAATSGDTGDGSGIEADAQTPAAEGDPAGEAPAAEGDPAGEAPAAEGDPAGEAPAAEGDPAGEAPAAEGDPAGETPPAEGDPADEGAGTEEEPAVVAPTVADDLIEVERGATRTYDLDDLVTAGSAAVDFISLSSYSSWLGLSYDEDTHVLTMTPQVAGRLEVRFIAEAADGGRSVEGYLTVDVTDPVVVNPVVSWAETPAASTTSTSARFALTVDAGQYTVGYVLDLDPNAQMGSPVEVQGSSFVIDGLSVGRHTIRVVVSRGEGWTGLDYVWDVVAAPVVAPPVAAPAAPVFPADTVPASVIRSGISRGATGPSVAVVQRLIGVDADGRFGPRTRAAIVAFQRAHGLVADGVVGPLTWAALVDVANGGTGVVPVTASAIPAAQIARGIARGASGSSVAVVQRVVGASADGRFGPRTQAAVRAWQRAHGLVADGIVGRLTWAAMTAS